MSKLTPLAVVLSIVLINGCAAPGDIQPMNQLADQEILANSQQLPQDNFSAANWPTENWWHQLADPQLDELVDQAMQHSPTIQLANASLTRASAMVMVADSLFEPQVNAEASATRARLSRSEDYSMQGNRYGTIYSMGLSGGYSFDLWGGNRAAWEASVNQQKAAEIDHQAAQVALSTGIVRTYVQLANAYALEDLAVKDLQRTQGIVRITQQLLDNGLTSNDRLYTAQSNAARAEQTLKQRQLTIAQLKNALATLVGQGPDLAQQISRPKAHLTTHLALPADVPANLLAHRPDMVAAKWRVEASTKNIEAAKTRFYPNVNLSAMVGFKAMLGDAVFDDVSRSWRVGPAISLPLFTSDLKANLIEKTADYDTAVALYNQSLVAALGDVSDSLQALQSMEQQLLDARESVRLADKSYRITEKRYESGMGSQLEVLMAETQLIQAESSLTLVQNQQQEQQVLLVQALGGGFHDPSLTNTPASQETH